MPPTIHFVRHGQGVHNTGSGNYHIQDPKLTPVGIDQCLNLRRTFPLSDKVGLVVASPLTRTIETALQAFEPVITRTESSIVALPELQETGNIPCDTGSPVKELQKIYAGRPVDLGLLDAEWHVKRGKYAQTDAKITARARAARRWLKDRTESDIVVVTHGGYLHYITEDWSDAAKYCGTGWANCEYRSYKFDPSTGDNASLVETAESQERRQKTPFTNHASSTS